MSLLRSNICYVNNDIHIVVPTVGEILDKEDDYFTKVMTIISTPIDFSVQLYDSGVDFREMSEFELFCIMFESITKSNSNDMSMIFGDLDTSGFYHVYHKVDNTRYLFNPNIDVKIHEIDYMLIVNAIRKINFLSKTKYVNPKDLRWYIDKERKKLQSAQRKRKKEGSNFERYVISYVNNSGSKYDYSNVMNLNVYQLMSGIYAIQKDKDYTNIMQGYYSGSIDPSHISETNWI